MKLAFIILNYNDYPSTSALLENIKDYQIIDLIVVVDNHSTDKSYQELLNWESEKIHLIRADENKGFASGLNLGCRYAKNVLGKCHLILSNADIVIGKEENIKELNDLIGKRNIEVLAPVITQKNDILRGWKIPTIQAEILGNLPVIGKKIYQKKINYPESHYKGEISIVGTVSGCFFMITSTLLDKIGYFDENTFLYYEENILGSRLLKTKYQIAVANKITVFHNHSVSVDKSINTIKKYKTLKKSQAYFCKEYLHATKFQLLLLNMTMKLTLLTLYIRNFEATKKSH